MNLFPTKTRWNTSPYTIIKEVGDNVELNTCKYTTQHEIPNSYDICSHKGKMKTYLHTTTQEVEQR
jgi:hypothetical protein